MQGKLKINKDHFDAYFDQLETQLDEVARGVVITFWNTVLAYTPQWTGAMAASWNFSYGAPDPVDRHDAVPDREEFQKELLPRSKGHPFGVDVANKASAPALNSYKLGEIGFMTNGVSDENANYYAQTVEDGDQRIRAVNRPGNAVAFALGVIDAKYSRGIGLSTAKQLMKLKM